MFLISKINLLTALDASDGVHSGSAFAADILVAIVTTETITAFANLAAPSPPVAANPSDDGTSESVTTRATSNGEVSGCNKRSTNASFDDFKVTLAA